MWAHAALAELELALGAPERALEQLEHQQRLLAEMAITDVDLSPAPGLVDVHLRLGSRDEARRAADAFLAAAEAKGQPWSLARALRCQGMVSESGEPFEAALAAHAQTPDAFEDARTRLAYGAWLRRSRNRVRAREQLRAAMETFERLDAHPWAESARSELAASGERLRRRDPSSLDELTPQELQIALLLASGKTTREAAAAVFLSPKTIEYHQRHVYLKLGVHSREELARRWSGAGRAPRPPRAARPRRASPARRRRGGRRSWARSRASRRSRAFVRPATTSSSTCPHAASARPGRRARRPRPARDAPHARGAQAPAQVRGGARGAELVEGRAAPRAAPPRRRRRSSMSARS